MVRHASRHCRGYSYLPREKNNAASGLINLSRNIGGSTGIAFATTMLARQAQIHQNNLISHISPYHPQARQTLWSIRQMLVHHGAGQVQAVQESLAMVYGTVQHQAAMLSYIDVFKTMALIFLTIAPLVILMRRIKPGAVAAH
ncbi:MAG TPA: hypothetical protein VHD56_18035 [Tepidisphaeraceae bacterium]|nr:hypothetical protein [Tepidisphaeraceae bacterium]